MTLEKKEVIYDRSTANISNIVSSIMTWLKFNGSSKEVEIFQVFQYDSNWTEHSGVQ